MMISVQSIRVSLLSAIAALAVTIPLVAQNSAAALIDQAKLDFENGLDSTVPLVEARQIGEHTGNLGLLIDVGELLAEHGEKQEAYNTFTLALQKAEPTPPRGEDLRDYMNNLLDLSRGFEQIEHPQNARAVLELALRASRASIYPYYWEKQVRDALEALSSGDGGTGGDPIPDEPVLQATRVLPENAADVPQGSAPRATSPRRPPLLPPFEYGGPLYGIDLSGYRERYFELLGFEPRLAKLEADLGELPGASGQRLVEVLTFIDLIDAVSAQAHQAHMARLAAEYLAGLDVALSEIGHAPHCADVDPTGLAEVENRVMQRVNQLEDALAEVDDLFELDYNDAFICSSLDTMSPPSPGSATEAQGGTRARLPSGDSGLSYRVELMPLPPPARTFGGFAGLDLPSGDLGRQIVEVRRQVSSGRPRRAGSAELAELEGRRMRTLAAVLFRVTRLESTLEYGEEMLAIQSRLDAQRRTMETCAAGLDDTLTAMGARVRGRVRPRLGTLRQQHLGAMTAPPLVASLRQWRSRHTQDVGTALAQLGNMASDLRTISLVRRQVWCQMRRQAELEAQLGPRRN